MKSLRNKVILSAIVLAFALIATIGSTYAWFTVSTDVTVQDITMNVSAADSLLIRVYHSADDSTVLSNMNNYKTILVNADIEEVYSDLLSYQLQPVTAIQSDYASVDAKTLYYYSDLNATTRPLTITTVDHVNNTTTGKYIELKFWLYSQSDSDKTIVLSDLNVTAADQSGLREDVVNAVRLGVWGDDTPGFVGSQGAGDAFIFGQNVDYDFAFTSQLPGYESSVDFATNGTFNSLSQNTTWAGVADKQTGVVATTAPNYGSEIYVLEPNTPTLFTVRIWVEGWDVNADNDVVLSQFAINWQFGYSQDPSLN